MCCDESGTETVVELQTDVLPSGTLRRKQTLKSFKAKFENRFVDTHPLWPITAVNLHPSLNPLPSPPLPLHRHPSPRPGLQPVAHNPLWAGRERGRQRERKRKGPGRERERETLVVRERAVEGVSDGLLCRLVCYGMQENEDSLEDWAESLTELSTMKTDLSQYIIADDVLLLQEQVEHLHCQWEELCLKVSLMGFIHPTPLQVQSRRLSSNHKPPTNKMLLQWVLFDFISYTPLKNKKTIFMSRCHVAPDVCIIC